MSFDEHLHDHTLGFLFYNQEEKDAITDSTGGGYGKWMNDLLEIYDGVIFARRFWKGVAFNLD